MKIGFIGTGEITKAVVNGIISSKIKTQKIHISQRNKRISKFLKNKSNKIKVIKNNQDIIDKSDWIFLAVTPEVANKILHKLNFKKNQIIVSFISTIKLKDLKKLIKVKTSIIRAIPLPPIALGKGPVPIYPYNKKVLNFFNKIGNSVVIKNEKLSLNFWAISSLMASYYELLTTSAKWLQDKGMKQISSQKYIISLFSSLSDAANLYSEKDLALLVKKSQTPKGLNEQTLKFLRKSGFYSKLYNALNRILKRLK